MGCVSRLFGNQPGHHTQPDGHAHDGLDIKNYYKVTVVAFISLIVLVYSLVTILFYIRYIET